MILDMNSRVTSFKKTAVFLDAVFTITLTLITIGAIAIIILNPANSHTTTKIDVAIALLISFSAYVIKVLAFGVSYSLIEMAENVAYLADRETERESREINKRDG
jgi:hypothetical protein